MSVAPDDEGSPFSGGDWSGIGGRGGEPLHESAEEWAARNGLNFARPEVKPPAVKPPTAAPPVDHSQTDAPDESAATAAGDSPGDRIAPSDVHLTELEAIAIAELRDEVPTMTPTDRAARRALQKLLAPKPAPKPGLAPIDQVLALVAEYFRTMRGTDDRLYYEKKSNPGILAPLEGAKFRQSVALAYLSAHGRGIGAQPIRDALQSIIAEANARPAVPVFLRHGVTLEGFTVIDQCNPAGEFLVVTGESIDTTLVPPCYFRRSLGQMPLPTPDLTLTVEGALEPLRTVFQVTESDFRLIIYWIVIALTVGVSHPILLIIGEQGSGKSTLARIILSFLDRSIAALGAPQADERDWASSMQACASYGIDNVTSIDIAGQSRLSRAVTGEAVRRRALNTDEEQHLQVFQRKIVMTAIAAPDVAPDLAQRMLVVQATPIHRAKRLTESEVAEVMGRAEPGVYGAILKLRSQLQANLSTTVLAERERLADFNLFVATLDRVTGWSVASDYSAKVLTASRDAVDGDAIGSELREFLQGEPGNVWAGTMAELCRILGPKVHGFDRIIRSPKGMQSKLAALDPSIRDSGGRVSWEHRRAGREYTIEWPPPPPETPSAATKETCLVCRGPLTSVQITTKQLTHPECDPTGEVQHNATA